MPVRGTGRGRGRRPWRPVPSYQAECRRLAGLRENPQAIASVRAPDSYPHVTQDEGHRPMPAERHRGRGGGTQRLGRFYGHRDLQVQRGQG